MLLLLLLLLGCWVFHSLRDALPGDGQSSASQVASRIHHQPRAHLSGASMDETWPAANKRRQTEGHSMLLYSALFQHAAIYVKALVRDATAHEMAEFITMY